MPNRILQLVVVSLVVGIAFDAAAVDKKMLRWVRQKPIIDSIVVEGNNYFSDSHIRSRLYSRVHNIWRAVKGDRRTRVRKETLSRDTLEIKFLYYSEGFLAVSVHESFEPIAPDSNALVRIVIDEGRRFTYGRKTFSGDFPGWMEAHFKKAARRLKESKPVNRLELRATSFDIKTFLANRGYPYASVIQNLDTTRLDNVVAVNFRIATDSLVQFGDIRISGNRDFPLYTARRELTLKAGNTYRREDILESQRRLFESGYFSTIRLKPTGGNSNRLRPDFELHVRERKVHFVTFSTGAGQSIARDLIWDISTGFGKRNFMRSRRLELSADYSFSLGEDSRLITHRYRLRFTEPWLFGIRMPMFLTGQYEPPLKDEVQDFKVTRLAASVRSNKRFGRTYEANIGFQYESVKITGVPPEQVLIIQQQDTISVRRRIDIRLRRDSRDDPFIPTQGNVTDIAAEYVGGFLGGDDTYYKIQSSWTFYSRTWPGWISASRLMVGLADPFGSSRVVPLDEALYLGGANTVRSFRENRLGPLDADGNPLGAKITIVVNQEFRWRTIQVLGAFPLLGAVFKSLPLWQSVFFDMGNGFAETDDIKFKNLAYVYGTGIQIVSPAGPIRLDYARSIKTERFSFAERWHFTILYAF